MIEGQRRAALLGAGASLAVTIAALSWTLVSRSSVGGALTLVAMTALALAIHAIGRTHAGT